MIARLSRLADAEDIESLGKGLQALIATRR